MPSVLLLSCNVPDDQARMFNIRIRHGMCVCTAQAVCYISCVAQHSIIIVMHAAQLLGSMPSSNVSCCSFMHFTTTLQPACKPPNPRTVYR